MGILDRLRGMFAAPPKPADTPAMPAPKPMASKTTPRFLRCVDEVFRSEGGYANDPKDRGGPTMMGITQATLADWRKRPVTAAEVAALTRAEALEIYRVNYWNRLRCDDLPPGIDLMVFDFGVNAGIGASAKMLQRALNVPSDGIIGPMTLDAARRAEPFSLLRRMAWLREDHYRSSSDFGHFGRGWLARNETVLAASIRMSQGL